jgi:hypothetical protein
LPAESQEEEQLPMMYADLGEATRYFVAALPGCECGNQAGIERF